MSRSEAATGGRNRSSILADTTEALIGAVYLDSGLESARHFIHRALAPEFSDLQNRSELTGGGDWKSRLQEWVHQYDGTSPQYQLEQESGPDHQKMFCMTVNIGGHVMGRGEGGTKKEAEQRAAEQAFAQVSRSGSDTMKNSNEA